MRLGLRPHPKPEPHPQAQAPPCLHISILGSSCLKRTSSHFLLVPQLQASLLGLAPCPWWVTPLPGTQAHLCPPSVCTPPLSWCRGRGRCCPPRFPPEKALRLDIPPSPPSEPHGVSYGLPFLCADFTCPWGSPEVFQTLIRSLVHSLSNDPVFHPC